MKRILISTYSGSGSAAGVAVEVVAMQNQNKSESQCNKENRETEGWMEMVSGI